jgi:hypothetical protein
MVDYWHPRQIILHKFGDQIAEVVDGFRPPTITERVYALLGSTPIGVQTNLMERDMRLDDLSGILWSIEDRADRIALALLAPPVTVLKETDLSAREYSQRETVLSEILRVKFGLPAGVAKSYCHALLAICGKGRSWLESVRLR